jgi:hypothetical protein
MIETAYVIGVRAPLRLYLSGRTGEGQHYSFEDELASVRPLPPSEDDTLTPYRHKYELPVRVPDPGQVFFHSGTIIFPVWLNVSVDRTAKPPSEGGMSRRPDFWGCCDITSRPPLRYSAS